MKLPLRIPLAVLLAVMLPLSLAAACPASPDQGSAVEVEDCDAEDWANRETDCGFAPTPKRTTGKPAPPKTPAKKSTKR